MAELCDEVWRPGSDVQSKIRIPFRCSAVLVADPYSRTLCFFFVGRRLILTHGFRKSGDKTPRREIDRAEACKKDFEGRVKHES